ncbi:MAG: rRNA pseudouridine synthase [Oscillospiraceae bacterium]|nr:rRNA pseudouridine synthase [Oscillospiraceae bacterium]
MKERLQKLIAAAGLCSRRTAEEWIIQGKVTVNGNLARLGDSADPQADEILVEGRPLPAVPVRTTTVLLYKPRGVVTTMQDEKGRPTVAELLPPELGRLYPVGRLDQFSEGLLLMTNDGALANRLTHPKGEVRKTYLLWVSGWQDGALEKLRRPITLDGYRIKPPEVRLLWECMGNRQQAIGNSGREDAPVEAANGRPQPAADSAAAHTAAPSDEAGSEPVGSDAHVAPVIACGNDAAVPASGGDRKCGHVTKLTAHAGLAALEITIHEGRNRQIRRMAEAAGLKTTRLKRIAEGPVQLGSLKPGEWRRLYQAELAALGAEKR